VVPVLLQIWRVRVGVNSPNSVGDTGVLNIVFYNTLVAPWPDPGVRWGPHRGATTGVAREIDFVWTNMRIDT
jgi:hypothetical protein